MNKWLGIFAMMKIRKNSFTVLRAAFVSLFIWLGLFTFISESIQLSSHKSSWSQWNFNDQACVDEADETNEKEEELKFISIVFASPSCSFDGTTFHLTQLPEQRTKRLALLAGGRSCCIRLHQLKFFC
jgi:hypothetical protein